MPLQRFLDIASRYRTAMADAMVRAIIAKCYAEGETVDLKPLGRGATVYAEELDPFHAEAMECMRQEHGASLDV
jgi:hypothetical protein